MGDSEGLASEGIGGLIREKANGLCHIFHSGELSINRTLQHDVLLHFFLRDSKGLSVSYQKKKEIQQVFINAVFIARVYKRKNLITLACSGICLSTRSVKTNPGQTVLVRIPNSPPSLATVFIKPKIPRGIKNELVLLFFILMQT
jgi:hypothetical protein